MMQSIVVIGTRKNKQLSSVITKSSKSLPKVKTIIFSDYLVLCVENDVKLHVNCNSIYGSDHISYSNITPSSIPPKTKDYVSFVDNCGTFWSINSQCVLIQTHYDCSYSYSEEPCRPEYQKES